MLAAWAGFHNSAETQTHGEKNDQIRTYFHEPHDRDAWVCICGNTPSDEGFATCDEAGVAIEPTKESSWTNLLVCQRCERIINQDSLAVVGKATGSEAPRTYRFTWQSIEVEAVYTPLKWNIIAHLEIRSIKPEGARLPITATGYLSHFHQPGTIEARGGDVVAQVLAWLDEATTPEWLAHAERSKQGELF